MFYTRVQISQLVNKIFIQVVIKSETSCYHLVSCKVDEANRLETSFSNKSDIAYT